METKEFAQSYNKYFESVKMAKQPLERDLIEIRLHSSDEVKTAIEHGFTIYCKEFTNPHNQQKMQIHFICVSFADLMTLQGK